MEAGSNTLENLDRLETSFLWKVFAGFLLFFIALFMQFPLEGSLPGMTDTWWYLAVFSEYGNIISSWFTGEDIGSCFYPNERIYPLGEPSFLSGVVFLFLKLFGLNDLWAWYGLICLIFASNGLGMTMFSSLYLKHRWAQISAGLIFSSCAFIFGHMDDQKVIVFYFTFLSIYYFKHFIEDGKQRDMLLAVVFGGLQIYFSSYNFLFQSIILGLLGLYHYKKILLDKARRLTLLKILPIYFIILIPFANIYIFNSVIGESHNPINVIEAASAVSLEVKDFAQPLYNNAIYPSSFEENPQWVYPWHSANLGIVIWVLFILGCIRMRFKKPELIVLFFFGLVIALGPSTQFGSANIKLPMYVLYQYVDAVSFLRIPIRAWFISLMALAIVAGFGIEYLQEKLNKYHYFLVIPLLLLLVENVPFPFQKYPSEKFLTPPHEYLEFFEGKKGEVILNLPSRLTDEKFHPGFSAPGREHIYMYWQTKLKLDVMNGHGYLPKTRLELQEILDHLFEGWVILDINKETAATYIVFHKNLLLPGEKWNYGDILKQNNQGMKLILENEEILILEVYRY